MPVSPLRLHVKTQSGKSLGQVVDIEVDPDSQTVVHYHVKPSRLVPDMVQSPLIIHRSQVIEFTDREITVEDATIRDAGIALDPTSS